MGSVNKHMKNKGITFKRCTEADAKIYLETKNNYFRVSAFRKLFDKHVGGKKDGQYIALDFEDMRQLSYADQALRSLLRRMSLDVEHYEKVSILSKIANNEGEDGYKIIVDYKASLNEDRRFYLDNEIKSRKYDVYCGNIIKKYGNAMPVWAFFEVISFGTFIDFCRFCSERWEDKSLLDVHYMLKKVKSVRNAASHGACMMNGFAEKNGNSKRRTSNKVKSALGQTSIPADTRKAWLDNARMRDIATLIYLFSERVKEGASKEKVRQELKEFFEDAETRTACIPENNRAVAGIGFMKTLTKELGLL